MIDTSANFYVNDIGLIKIEFETDNAETQLLSDLLQDDVGVLPIVCDVFIEGLKEGWSWNGDRFLVEIQGNQALITDKIGKRLELPKKSLTAFTMDVSALEKLALQWKGFIIDPLTVSIIGI